MTITNIFWASVMSLESDADDIKKYFCIDDRLSTKVMYSRSRDLLKFRKMTECLRNCAR